MPKNLLLSAMIASLFGLTGALAQDAESQDATPETPVPAEEAGEPVSDDVFIPSEEVQAAEELAFPVDI